MPHVLVKLYSGRSQQQKTRLDEFAAVRFEGAKIGIDGIQDRTNPNIRLLGIIGSAERVHGPAGIGKHDVPEEVGREQSLQREGRIAAIRHPNRPIDESTRLSGSAFVAREHAGRSGKYLPDGRNLVLRQRERIRIEVTGRRIVQELIRA